VLGDLCACLPAGGCSWGACLAGELMIFPMGVVHATFAPAVCLSLVIQRLYRGQPCMLAGYEACTALSCLSSPLALLPTRTFTQICINTCIRTHTCTRIHVHIHVHSSHDHQALAKSLSGPPVQTQASEPTVCVRDGVSNWQPWR